MGLWQAWNGVTESVSIAAGRGRNGWLPMGIPRILETVYARVVRFKLRHQICFDCWSARGMAGWKWRSTEHCELCMGVWLAWNRVTESVSNRLSTEHCKLAVCGLVVGLASIR